jgi:enoyl-CoA hydratase
MEKAMSTYTTILTETHKRVGLVRFNRPEVMNALNTNMVTEMMDALAFFDEVDTIGAMVITGNEKAFAAGADIKEMMDETAVEMLLQDHIAPFDRIKKIKKPVIAAVSGWCLGGGNELALSCDMIIASESASFGQPEINLGVIPGAGGTQRLTRAVGKALAMEMVLNNRTLTAKEAYQFGLVNRVVPEERYLEEALELAAEIATRAPIAIQLGKEAVNYAHEAFLTDGLGYERRLFYFLFSTNDQSEGMQAFSQKRKPAWKGK